MNYNDLELIKHKMKQFEREAKNNRLVREARSGDQPMNPVLNSVLAALGEQLVEMGLRLQERNEQSARVPKFEVR